MAESPQLRTIAARPAKPSARPLSIRYRAIRAATEALAAPLSDEDCAIQSMPDASPVKWHLAHTSWFFETFVLEPGLPGYRPYHPSFRMLFNSYYNTVGDKHPRPRRGLLSRPSRPEVLAYRGHVDAALLELLARVRDGDGSQDALIELGLQHEQQHQELILTDVLHLLSCNPLQPPYASADKKDNKASAAAGAAAPAWIEFDGGLAEIGHGGGGFAFDNESPRHREYLAAFALASRPVTNGEYLAFIGDGGYRRPELWLAEGWDWVNAEQIGSPLYWRRDTGEWHRFTLRGVLPVEPAAPVCHVSLYEADAFARWAGARLPTEAEWEVAAVRAPIDGGFIDDGALLARPSTAAGGALTQMYGDVWEWTQSGYAPYPGYRPAAGAIAEYNGKFMCNQYVLRGGSCVTPRSHIRASYRNFFPAAARWQFSGLRLARDLPRRAEP
ncbi:MAG: ergothioneine biosynthesis protein EgtB [Casimicrobiaceae bacterium]